MHARLLILALVTICACDSGADILAPPAGRPSIDPISPTAVPVEVQPVYVRTRARVDGSAARLEPSLPDRLIDLE